MGKRALLLSLCGFVFCLAGCFGRLPDSEAGRQINPKDYGLDGTRPALIVFSAVWCKPCMSEVSSLNRANSDLGGQVQIVGFVVEGAQKGVAASEKDTKLVSAPDGEKPNYALIIDPGWRRFEALQPSDGHSLPTMVFVDRDRQIVHVVQRSLEYDSELLPLLKSLAAGDLAPQPPNDRPTEPEPSPSPAPAPPGESGHNVTLSFADWAAAPGNASDSTMYTNVEAAWTRGLGDYNFLPDDMPFETASIYVTAFDDGHTVPLKAKWIAATTGCSLTVYFNPDGTYNHSTGVCR